MTTIPPRCTVVGRLPGSPASLRLAETLRARGLRVALCRPHEAAGRESEAWLLRLPSGTPDGELALLADREGEGGGGVWIDRPSTLQRVHDKGRQLALLADAGHPVIPTRRVLRDHEVVLPTGGDDAFVVKPVRGAAGRGVTLPLPPDRARRSARAFADLVGAALVQPFLGAGLDHRLFVVAGEVVSAMRRRPGAGDARGSSAYGAVAERLDPDPAAVTLALDTAACLGLSVAGVDLLRHEDRWTVLEVNSCPGLQVIEAATGRDVAGAVAAHVARSLDMR